MPKDKIYFIMYSGSGEHLICTPENEEEEVKFWFRRSGTGANRDLKDFVRKEVHAKGICIMLHCHFE